MRNKNFAVFFTSNNARIVKNPHPDLLDHPNTILNPDLSQVQGVPPHYWYRVGDEIRPMNREQRLERDIDHSRNGVDNKVWVPSLTETEVAIEAPAPRKAPVNWFRLGEILGWIVLGAILFFIFARVTA